MSEDPITFTEYEDWGLIHPHNNATMVNLQIDGQRVHEILINNGSSVDVLFSSTLDLMNLVGHTFTPVHTPLYGFSRESIHTEGELDLPFQLRDAPC